MKKKCQNCKWEVTKNWQHNLMNHCRDRTEQRIVSNWNPCFALFGLISPLVNFTEKLAKFLIGKKTQKWVECIWRTLGVPESSLVSNVKLFWRIEVNFFQPVSLEPQEELFSSTRSSTLNMGMYSYDPSTGTPEYQINFTTLLGSGIWMVEPFHQTWMNSLSKYVKVLW